LFTIDCSKEAAEVTGVENGVVVVGVEARAAMMIKAAQEQAKVTAQATQ
jgi:hypothetical protein